MNRLVRMVVMASTLTLFFIFFAKQTAGEVHFPCILTESQKALVSELTRFDKSSYFITQANIKECVILGVATLLIRYENGHIGLFHGGEMIYSDGGQKQMEPRDMRMTDTLHDVHGQHIDHDDAEESLHEFLRVWNSNSPNELSQEDLARADAFVQKSLNATQTRESMTIIPLLGSRGNRYLALIEKNDSLPIGTLVFFYEAYLGTEDPDLYTRSEDIPTDDDKQVVIQKLINILERIKPPMRPSSGLFISRQIKKFDPDSYARLVERELIVESDE